jgi:glucose/arabinose dehydrogenase
MKKIISRLLAGAAALSIAACGNPHPPPKSSYGSHPDLPAPKAQFLPTLSVNSVERWPAGAAPKAPEGFTVTRFAENLHHPRWVYVLPNGDVLVAEAAPAAVPMNSPENIVEHWLDAKNGSAPPNANDIVLLRDTNGDGKPDVRTVFLKGLNQPFGMLLLNGSFYVGNTNGVMRFSYKDGETQITDAGQKILDLPTEHHWTRNLIASEDGKKIYVAVGSFTNIAEKGIANEKRRADILQINPDGSGERVLASGLRNPNGMDFEPTTHKLWVVVNERDLLGDDLVPDYLTSVKDGAFYGWPWSYWGNHVDVRVQPQNPQMVAKAIAPDYALSAHVAPLGMTFYKARVFPAHYQGGAFVGEHGSWNRAQKNGYKVVYVAFANGQPTGLPEDFLTDFLAPPDGDAAYGRPVGVTVAKDGALLVADDVGNIVWRVAPNGK